MKYRATVLTPTLVGDGHRLAPIDYMVWRDKVNVLDQNRIFRLLSKGPKLEGYLKQLQTATRLDFGSWGGFAQNYADRRIPFEDEAYMPLWERAPIESLAIPTFASQPEGPFLPGAALKGALRTAYVFAQAKPQMVRELAAQLSAGERVPRHPAEQLEKQTAGSGGSDRMRVFSIGDSEHIMRDTFRVFLLRVATLQGTGEQFKLGWKQAGRGAVDGKRPDDSTPSFAEMAGPGAVFEGLWRENNFLNGEQVRASLRWSNPVTRKILFNAANQYAAKQLELHAQYAAWAGLDALAASVEDLLRRLTSVREADGCLLSIGWGAGFLSKSAAIGADDAEHRKLLGMLPYYRQAIQSGLPFPKTRKIVFLKNRPATLPGWVELQVG